MSQDKPYKDEDRLRRLYWDEGKSIKETAEACDCAINTIQRYMDKYDIPTRDEAGYAPDEQPKHRNKDWLREKYHGENMRLYELADKAAVSETAILENMKKHGIERRKGYKVNYAYFFTNNNGHEVCQSWTQEGGKKYALIHRLVAVAHLGFEPVKDMHVHHDNDIPWDNRPVNLKIWTESKHRSHHAKQNKLHEYGAKATRED